MSTNESRSAAGSAAASPERSVFLAALGADAERLRPEVLRYVAGPPAGARVGIGEGVFEVAGSRFSGLTRLARPVVGPQLLVTAHERDVPFRIENRPAPSPDGRVELRAERWFRFSSGEQRFVDVLRVGSAPGTLRNLLGAARRVELELRCDVTPRGHLRMRSERAWLRAGRLRLPLPRPLSVRAEVEDGYDETAGRHTIRASVRNPIVGLVMEYRGWFSYRYETR